MQLLIRSLLVTVVLLVSHEAIFRLVKGRYQASAENITVGNGIVGQDYLYERANANYVIVGSSLSGRIQTGMLPTGTITLGLSGLGAWDGLSLVGAAATKPRVLLVEANMIFRRPSIEYQRHLLGQPWRFLRGRLVGLRDAARPIAFLADLARALWRRVAPITVVDESVSAPIGAASLDDDGLFERLITAQRRLYDSPLSGADRDFIAAQAKQLRVLASAGVHVEFFEMPVNPALCDSTRPLQLRTWLRLTFPEIPYRQIGRCADFETTDGIHLSTEEAERWTLGFAETMQAMIP
ncbi:MAG: hypothetical protein AB7E72_05040 [Lysobacterales bacterium]